MKNSKKEEKTITVFRQGKRLYLRPIQKEDIPVITQWINDQNLTQYLTTAYPMTIEEETRWFDKICLGGRDNVILALVLNGTHKSIGHMGLHKIDYIDGTAVTGSIIGSEKHRNKGYGTEAKMLLLEYAFNTLNLRKVCSEVYDFNLRSKKCLEKCGYQEEGVKKKHVYRNGEYRDVHIMAVFKEDFIRLQNRK